MVLHPTKKPKTPSTKKTEDGAGRTTEPAPTQGA
jgi:hypothetical protein